MLKRIKKILWLLNALAILAWITIFMGNREIPIWIRLAGLSALLIPTWYTESKQDYIATKLERRILLLTPIVALCASIIYGLVNIFY